MTSTCEPSDFVAVAVNWVVLPTRTVSGPVIVTLVVTGFAAGGVGVVGIAGVSEPQPA
jgi:hypothetical protein